MKYASAILAFPSVALAVCHHGTSLWSRDVTIASFNYEGETGPIGWAALDEANEACATGTRQSPVNLVVGAGIRQLNYTDHDDRISIELPDIEESAEFENLGSTLEVVMEGKGASIEYDGVNATLKQFHFHTPSEHHINGEYYPMEAHFVFDAGESIIVLGIPIEIEHRDSYLMHSVFKHVEEISAPGSTSETGPLSFKRLLHHVERSAIWSYSGSLTTPPCSEVVTWLVVDKPIAVSPHTYKTVKHILGYNARYTQNEPGKDNLLEFANKEIFG
ncbi:putative carbonic anhydrase [Zalerion maritima]|uniref:Carbonic anhydrase n=1 Tax=Zalerion maritima TaxID=339359 RepID=A0AAD5WXU4_9PEZI|nr:putative carbonic anhydrase [Zalerion maritima]